MNGSTNSFFLDLHKQFCGTFSLEESLALSPLPLCLVVWGPSWELQRVAPSGSEWLGVWC